MGEFDRFTALSFDCYGTLIDWEAGIGAALDEWAGRHDLDVDPSRLVDEFASIETHVQREQPALRYPLVLAEVMRRIGLRFGVAVSPGESERFGASVGAWPAFPDSPDALRRLHSRFSLVILSNVDRASFAASNARLGVEFDLIVTAEDVGAYKPSAASFPALIGRLPSIGVERGGLLHVAQSLYHDHEPAQRAGLPSVWIDRRHGRVGYGATPPPRSEITPRWRYPSLAAFADAAVGAS